MTTHVRTDLVEVWIWGQRVGAVAPDPARSACVFEYDPAWVRRGIDLAPLTMPIALASRTPIYQFPDLSKETFHGLPGLLADALPDAFGNALIDAWMATHGIRKDDVSSLDKLAYMGSRAMGALTFKPPSAVPTDAAPIAMQSLVEAARKALRADFTTNHDSEKALQTMIDVGTSAGGMRAKAVIAWNPETQEVRSGQFDAPPGFEHWLLKIDTGKDMVLGESQGFGRIEYAYHRMALDAGVEMMPCRLLEENGRAHFMTRRFDRDRGERLHVQSLCALAHMDYKQTATHSYEQLFMVAGDLVGHAAMQDIFTRMCFNIAARNCDDHTKNFAFMLKQHGEWALAPAYDVMYSYRADSDFVSQHLMSVNGKFDDFHVDDILAIADRFDIDRPLEIMARIDAVVASWPTYARDAGVSDHWLALIQSHHQPFGADATKIGTSRRRARHAPGHGRQ